MATAAAGTHGLRERKKLDTRRALGQAAQDLVRERGLEGVSVDEIADAAGVSVRTFFNYFSCKEEAIVGVEPRVLAEIAESLRNRPPSEGPAEALRAVLLADDAESILRRWQVRTELVGRHPALLPRHLTALVQVEETLASALAERLGIDPGADPWPRVFVASALAALRTSLDWWGAFGRGEPLDQFLDRALSHLSPEPSSQRKR